MKNPELYNKTVGILVDAYFKNTLLHVDCMACAVGNIVAANMGIRIVIHEDNVVRTIGGQNNRWFRAIGGGFVHPDKLTPEVMLEVNATGYDPYELAKIEDAFEKAYDYNNNIDLEMYNGLVNVIDVLDEIHENKDTEATQTTKARFKKETVG